MSEPATILLPGEDPSVERWTAARKAEVVRRFDAGEVDLNTLLRVHRLTLEEFNDWRVQLRRRGVDGLKTTKTQQRRLPGLG